MFDKAWLKMARSAMINRLFIESPTGDIIRIDRKADGFAAYLVGLNDCDWFNRDCMALIEHVQEHIKRMHKDDCLWDCY